MPAGNEPKRAAREACLEIRTPTVEVKPPHARKYLQPVIVNVILVAEVGGPGDGTDVSWQLLTSLPIDTVEEVLLVVNYYRQRWAVAILGRGDFLPVLQHILGCRHLPSYYFRDVASWQTWCRTGFGLSRLTFPVRRD